VKTISLKKVSAVAVASLGFGLLSVVPANATVPATSTITPTTSVLSVAVGSVASTTVKVTVADQIGHVWTLTAANVSKPADATTAAATVAAGNASTKFVLSSVGAESPFLVAGTTSAEAKSVVAHTSAGVITASGDAAGNSAATNKIMGTFSYTPDKPGVYVFSLTSNTTTPATANITIYAGYSGADATNANVAFMTQGAAITSAATATAGGVATVRVTNFADTSTDDYYSVVVTGGSLSNVSVSGNIDKDTAGTPGFNLTNGASLSAGINFYVDSAATVSDTVDLQVTSATAGTVTITVTGFNATTGIGTVHAAPSITFGTALSTSATVSTSKIYVIDTHATEALSTSTAPGNIARAAGTNAAAFTIIVNDGYGNPINAQSVSAVVTGPGLINGGSGPTTASGTPAARVVATTTDSAGKASFNLDADGTAGVSTVTFSAGSTVLGSKTVTFYGAVAKYTATPVLNAVAGTATADAVNVSAVDAAGIAIPGETIYAFSSSTTTASVEASDTTATTAVATESNAGNPATYVSAKAIGTAGFTVTPSATTTATSVTITFGNAATIALSTVTTTAVVAIGGVEAATVTLTANKTSYAPGEAVTLTLTYKDALGRLTGTNPGTTLVASSSSSVGLGGAALPTAGAIATKVGTKTYAVFAPLTGGPVTVTVTSGTDAVHLATAARSVASTVTFNVTDPTAAIATSIASLNAKIVALNALIAKIMKRLNIR
jgi:hypothetical protein